MSLRTVRYLSCNYCDCRPIRLDETDPWPEGWLESGGNKHCCPECWKKASIVRQPPLTESLTGLALLSDAANDAPPYNFSFAPPTPLDPKISAPRVPTTHGCERFVVGEAADDTGDA